MTETPAPKKRYYAPAPCDETREMVCPDCGVTHRARPEGTSKTGKLIYRRVCPRCYRARYRAKRMQKAKDNDREWLRTIWSTARARALNLDLPFDRQPPYEDLLPIPAYCPVLGIRMRRNLPQRMSEFAPSLDRIVHSAGYVKGNVRLISGRANRLKQNATPEESLRLAINAATYADGPIGDILHKLVAWLESSPKAHAMVTRTYETTPVASPAASSEIAAGGEGQV